MVAGGWMLLAWMMADAGTPWRRAMASMVSPGPTLIALPPSQVQLPLEPGLRTTEPLPSGAPAGAGRAAPGPLLAATGLAAASLVGGALAGCAACGGSGRLSTRPAGAPCPCQTVPVVSGAEGWLAANGLSLNRVVSLLQPATPIAISVSTAARGHRRARNLSGTRDIATPSHAIQAAS